MYTILITQKNELITTVKERIMQRSKLVDKLRFLVEPIYNGEDMREYTAVMKFLKPVSKEYEIEYLMVEPDLYEGKLSYIIPADTDITSEPGDVTLSLHFFKVGITNDGVSQSNLRKTSETVLTVIQNSAWSDIIPDDELDDLDKKIIKIEAMAKSIDELAQSIDGEKADNICIEGDNIYLSANGNKIGTPVVIPSVNVEEKLSELISIATTQEVIDFLGIEVK